MGTEDQAPSTRDSSKRLVEIAQEVMRTLPLASPEAGATVVSVDANSYNRLLEKAKSLAGSVISQANPND
jgi:hypothetical protein